MFFQDNRYILDCGEEGLRELLMEILPESNSWPIVKTQGVIVARRPDKHSARQKKDPHRNIGLVQVSYLLYRTSYFLTGLVISTAMGE